MLRAYRVLAGSLRHAYHFKNPMFSRKVQVKSRPLSFCHVLKRPKDIESDMFSGGLVYLFCTHEIHCLNYCVILAKDASYLVPCHKDKQRKTDAGYQI